MEGIEERVGQDDRAFGIASVIKQAAVEVGDVDAAPPGDVARALRVHRLEEQRLQYLTIVVEGLVVTLVLVGVQLGRLFVLLCQEPGPATQPALTLQKVQEHQPAHQPLCEGMQLVVVVKLAHTLVVLANDFQRALEVLPVLIVEALRDALDVERLCLRIVDLLPGPPMRVDGV